MGKSFKLRNGLLLLSTEAPGGVYNASQLKKIAALCEGDSAIAKATEDQRLAVFAAPEKAAQIAKELRAVGLGVRHYQDGLHQPVNCIGELCGEHQQDAMGASMDLARSLGGTILTAAPLKIGINGCGRCCVPTHTLDISVVGEAQGYRLSLGGRNAQLPELATYIAEGIPAAELPDLLAKVVNLYKSLAQPGETLQAVLERCGSRPFLEALAPYSQDGFGADSLDLGAEPLASDLDLGPEEDVGAQDFQPQDLDESQLEGEPPQESPASEYEEIAVEESSFSAAGVSKLAGGSSERAAPHQKASKATPEVREANGPMPDLQNDLMDGLPGFDPSLEGGEASSGPTIDGLDLAGDGHRAIGLEPELLDDDLPHEEAMPRLDDQGELDDLASTAAGAEIQDDVGQDISLPEGPIAPVEDDFDAQQALSDDFDEQVFADASDENSQPQDDVRLEAVAGLDPIEDLSADVTVSSTAPGPSVQEASPTKAVPDETPVADEEFEAEQGAEEVVGSDADALEAKLAASIAAEESIVPVVDENAAARMEAMNIISGESLPISESVESALDVPDDFSDLQIDAEPVMEPDVLEAPDVDVEDFELEEFEIATDSHEASADLSPESGEDHPATQTRTAQPQHSELVSPSKTPSAPSLRGAPSPNTGNDGEELASKVDSPVPDLGPTKPSSRQSGQSPSPTRKETTRTSEGGFSLSGVDLIDDGRVSLAFASGMSLVVDPRTIAPGMTKGFNFGGQRINITAADHGLNVEVDGVTIFLPGAA